MTSTLAKGNSSTHHVPETLSLFFMTRNIAADIKISSDINIALYKAIFTEKGTGERRNGEFNIEPTL